MAAVDVVIVTFDRPADYLARAIDDVLAQRFTDWHLYIGVDGTDPDKASRLVAQRELEQRATVIPVPEQIGIPALVNKCVGAGASEFFAKHDDDDTWHPHFLTRTVEHIRATDDLVVGTRLEIVFEEYLRGRFIETGRKAFHPNMDEVTFFDLLRSNHVIPISMLIRRSAWEQHPFNEDRLVVDDWEFNLAVALSGRYGFIDEVLAYWHQRPKATGVHGNTVISGQRLHRLDDRRVREERLHDFLENNSDGLLLYLAKFVDERTVEMERRLAHLDRQNEQLKRTLQKYLGQDKP